MMGITEGVSRERAGVGSWREGMGRGGCRWRPERRSMNLGRSWGWGRRVVREEVRRAEASMGGYQEDMGCCPVSLG